MLIRTQDRKRIVNFDNLASMGCFENTVFVNADIGEGFLDLGEYESHERAMEILDILWETTVSKSRMPLTMIMPKE